MKVIDIIKLLTERGYRIEVSARAEGGYRITKINGISYKGSEGNVIARKIVGSQLSERQQVHLQQIRTPKGKFGHKRKQALPKDVKKALQRVQRKWRAKEVEAGVVTTPNVRYQLEHYGRDETIRKLYEREKYAEGIAYSENVEWMISYIRDTILPKAKTEDVDRLYDIMDILDKDRDNIEEADISWIHDVLYDYRDGKISIEQAIKTVQTKYR